jgi:hypothetical protein
MSDMQFLREKNGVVPSTIAHALELLRANTDFSNADIARISVGPCLPASQPAWGFGLVYQSARSDRIFCVLLSACALVHAIRQGHSDREPIGIEELDGATVTADGGVTLINGSRIRAVEAQGVTLPYELSDRDWHILHLVIEMIGGEDWAYRSSRQGVPIEFQKTIPHWKTIDFSALAQWFTRGGRVPLLKQIRYQYEVRFPELPTPTIAKISDTLKKVGLRKQ